MKKIQNLSVILSFLFLIGCQQNPPVIESSTEKPNEIVKVENTPEFSLEKLTKEQKESFEKKLPAQVREILENAEDFKVLFWNEADRTKKTIRFKVSAFTILADTVADVTESSSRRELLQAVYQDVLAGGAMMACFKPHHTIAASRGNKSVIIAICYSCRYLTGKISNGKLSFSSSKSNKEFFDEGESGETFAGSFPKIETSKSVIFFDRLIEKYGVDVR